MSVTASLAELIDLRRYAKVLQYQTSGKAFPSGDRLSKVRGRGMEFAETRNYAAGDDIRHMEWRITARTGKPHVKIYHEAKERPVILLVDFNPSMVFGTRIAFKSVVAARLAALIAWTTVTADDRVGGFFFSATEHSEFMPRGRESAVLPLLASLSHYTSQWVENAKPRPLSDALVRMQRVIRPGSLLVLVSDFYGLDQESEKHLHRLRSHNDLLAYHVCDALELAVPKPQCYPITNGQQQLLLDTGNAGVARAYAQVFQTKAQAVQDLCKRLQMHYVEVTAATDLTRLVKQTLPRRAHA